MGVAGNRQRVPTPEFLVWSALRRTAPFVPLSITPNEQPLRLKSAQSDTFSIFAE